MGNEISNKDNPSKETLLASICPGMSLNRAFFLKIYGYEISYPGFADMALSRLQILGCSRAREYYVCVVAEYEHQAGKGMKEAAAWYKKQLEEKFERKVVRKSRTQREISTMKSELLRKKLQLLKQRKEAE